MRLSDKDIQFCIQKAMEIAELYHTYVHHQERWKSVDEVINLCTTYLEKRIRIVFIAGPPSSIRGYYIRYPDHYDIVLYADMEPEWHRFVLCKELFHVILDEDEGYRTLNIYDHIEEVMTTFPMPEGHPGPAATSEMMAEIAAMEFLFPYAMRVNLVTKPALNFEATSSLYKIPQVLVEEYLADSFIKALAKFAPAAATTDPTSGE